LSLPAGQLPVDALPVALYDQASAEMDPERRRRVHANIVATPEVSSLRRP
jgi:hypothetical protein